MKVLVVLPTYNECDNIEQVLRRIRDAVPPATVLVVDDGSPDGTAKMAEALGKELGNVEVLRRNEKSGLGSAYRAGFRWGMERGFEACVEMDADLSHEPEALPELLAPLSQGCDVVIGSRYVPGGSIPDWTLFRRLLSRGGNLYADALLGLRVADSTAGFRAYSTELLDRIDLDRIRAEGYGFQIEMTYEAKQAGATITEVPIRFSDRLQGDSKMSTAIVVEALALVSWWGVQRLFAGGPRAVPPRAYVTTGTTGTSNRVLVVDDEPYITDVVTSALAFEGFATDEAASGSQALEKARIGGYDFIVLDVMLPDIDGLEVCRRLRAEDIRTPVMFLTARDASPDKLAGLALGDDYVTKPFSIDELVARIRAVLRRTALEDGSDGDRLRLRDLVMDVESHRVWRADQPIELTATEFRLLHFLLVHPRQVLSKTQILDAVWEDSFAGESNIVEIYISYLRKKVDCFDPPLIHTVRGVGYCVRDPSR